MRRHILYIAGLIVTLAVNAAGAAGLINKMTQKDVSELFPTFITPAPVTFSIWGVIYILLFAALVTGAVLCRKNSGSGLSVETGKLFLLSCFLNSAWIIAFSFIQIEAAAGLIIMLAVNLIIICRQLCVSGAKRIFKWAFGLYGGWVFMASFVNLFAVVTKYRQEPFSGQMKEAALITLAVVYVLLVVVSAFLENITFLAGGTWAYAGIFLLETPLSRDLLRQNILISVVPLISCAGAEIVRRYSARKRR